MNRSPISKLLVAVLYVTFGVGVVMVATLPWMMDHYMRIFFDVYMMREGYRTFITLFMMLVGTLGLWIVGELIAMLRTVQLDPFVSRNVHALRRMGVVALATGALFLGKCLLYVTPLTLGCGLLLLICSLSAFTLSDLFRQAVAYKEENDLTI